jgi:hypothetical protein
MKTHYKSTGVASVIFGVCLLMAVAFVIQQRGLSFLIGESDLWLVRYSIVIAFITGPLWFIMGGVLIWIGIFPSNQIKNTSVNKALEVAFILFPLPMWIALSSLVYSSSSSIFWISAWTGFMGYLFFVTVRGITKTVKES